MKVGEVSAFTTTDDDGVSSQNNNRNSFVAGEEDGVTRCHPFEVSPSSQCPPPQSLALSSSSHENIITGNSSRSKKELHIAPMINFSDRHFRALLRILSRRCILWTEMIADNTILNASNRDTYLKISDESEHPVICQIGGNSPDLAGKCAAIIKEYGYDEINLNCECPSDKVANQRSFGAALLKNIDLIVDIVSSMKSHCDDHKNGKRNPTPVSIKTRIGVDDLDDLDFICNLVKRLSPVCKRFIVHARKVYLHGLSARQNRSIPPLNYRRVYELCRRFPDCEFWLNGGIRSLKQAKLVSYGQPQIITPEQDDNVETEAEPRLVNDAFGDERDNNNNDADPEVTSSSKETKNRNNRNEENFTKKSDIYCHTEPPCNCCSLPYGSCTAPPPGIAPGNLRGCMLGRAAIDNVIMFGDVDRYFYDDERGNPCTNRRDVFNRYCEYLERTYPKRCCDSDERVSYTYPPPRIIQERSHCYVCEKFYRAKKVTNSSTLSPRLNTLSLSCNEDENHDKNVTVSNKNSVSCHDTHISDTNAPGVIKISSRVIGASIKPIQSICYGLPCNKAFRRVCDELGKDLKIRNCGPGFILRLAMDSIPDKYLDQKLPQTKDD